MSLKCIVFWNVIKHIIVNDCFVICVGSSLLSKVADLTIEPEIGIPHDLLISIEDRSLDSKTPICQVQSLLGMTPTENVLGTTAFKGYVNTPIQTLDGIVVQQPK